MSYLIHHVTRAPGRVLPLRRGLRVDEHSASSASDSSQHAEPRSRGPELAGYRQNR